MRMPQDNSKGDGEAAPKRTGQRRKRAKRRASRAEAPADAEASDEDEVCAEPVQIASKREVPLQFAMVYDAAC